MGSRSDRGLRNPRHTFGVQTPVRTLMPFMMAPLRPGETLVGLRLQCHAAFNQMVKYYHSVPAEVEFCIWKVSVRQIGEFFVDMFTSDLDDTRSTLSVDPSTGQRIAPLPINTQGNQSRVPLQVRDRLWAGESGQADGEVTIAPQAAYAPYVSHALWHIARMCYDLRLNTNNEMLDGTSILNTSTTEESPNLYQFPPPLGRLVRSATNSAMGWQAGLDATPTATSLSEWASRLSLVDNPNRTYQEYLKAFGVDPRRIEGMPEPVLMQRRHLRPLSTAGQVAYVPAPTAAVNLDSSMGLRSRNIPTSGGGTNSAIQGDFGGLYNVGAVLDQTRGKRLFVEEPSFLVGTVAWWPYDLDQRAFANVFDAVYMINSGTWGDPTGGAVDERDFLINRALDNAQTGTSGEPVGSAVTGQNEVGQSGPFVMNMLNLFLNGDNYTTSPTYMGHIKGMGDGVPATDDSYGSTPTQTLGSILKLYSYGSCRFGVATDLVNR